MWTQKQNKKEASFLKNYFKQGEQRRVNLLWNNNIILQNITQKFAYKYKNYLINMHIIYKNHQNYFLIEEV